MERGEFGSVGQKSCQTRRLSGGGHGGGSCGALLWASLSRAGTVCEWPRPRAVVQGRCGQVAGWVVPARWAG
eukprot:913078-Prymnesium_polylepis.1